MRVPLLLSVVARALHPSQQPPASFCSSWWKQQQKQWSRPFSVDGKIGADEGEVAELIEASLAPRGKRSGGAAADAASSSSAAPRVLTTRREALSLYREVLRYSNLFVWRDERGRVWRDVLRASARAEFEAARYERDPELVGRMLVTGRDAVRRAVEGFMKKRDRIIEEEAAAADAAGGGGRGPPFGGGGGGGGGLVGGGSGGGLVGGGIGGIGGAGGRVPPRPG